MGWLAVLALALACRPHPKPPTPGDSTNTDTAVVVDSTPPAPDSLEEDACTSCDTLTAADTLVGLGARPRRLVNASALAIGLTQWPTSKFCTGPLNATMDGTSPSLLGGVLRAAARCGMRIVTVAPRAMMTQNGETNGLYVVGKAEGVCDAYASRVQAEHLDTLVRNGTWLGVSMGDDFTNASVWGGREVTQSQAYDVVTYCQNKLPDALPIGLRQTPQWIAGSGALASRIDFGWAQWLGKRGDAQTFYDKAWAVASHYGFKMAGGLNVHSCTAAGADDPCTPSVLKSVGEIAEDHPGISVFLSWRYDPDDWAKLGPTWAYLAQRAAGKPKRSLLRGAP
jgi:hypothetical protein